MSEVRTHYRPREVAKARGVKVDVVLDWIHSGELRAIDCSAKPGGRPRWRISKQAIAQFDARRASSASIQPPVQRVRRRRKPELIEFF